MSSVRPFTLPRQSQPIRRLRSRASSYQAQAAQWALPPTRVSLPQLQGAYQAAFLYFPVLPALARAQEVQHG